MSNQNTTPQAQAPVQKVIALDVAATFGCYAPNGLKVKGFDRPGRHTPELEANYELRPEVVSQVMAWWAIGRGEGLYLTGPSGSGKSSLVRQICAMMGYGLQHMVGHARLEFPEMVSTIHIRNGNTVVTPGPLAKAMREGQVFLLDEIDLIDPSTNAALNEVLQGKPLTIPETGEVIKPHELFRFVATGNTAGAADSTGLFQGTVQQNAAFMDRFWHIPVGYPSADVEEKILRGLPPLKNAPKAIIDKMIQVAHAVRDAYMGENSDGQACEVTMSTRTLKRWAMGMAYFKPLSSKGQDPAMVALDLALCNRANPESAAFIRGIAQRVFGE